MLRYAFLIGNETPMDLLTLSLFLSQSPPGDIVVGIQRSKLVKRKFISKVFTVFRRSGLGFVIYNIFLNMGQRFMFDKKTEFYNIAELRLKYKFHLFYFNNVNDEEAILNFKKYSPDLIINHMPQVIHSPLINLFPRGVINIHPGLLPDYQGMGSCIWPLIEKNGYHGTTLHYIDSDKIDVGPIIISGRFAINANDSALSLHIRSRVIAALLANHVVKRFSDCEEVSSKFQYGGVYHKLPERPSLKRMKALGHRYFRWSDRKIVSSGALERFEYYDEKTEWKWKDWIVSE